MMTQKIISVITVIVFIPVQLVGFDFERPHEEPIEKPLPESCSADVCYSIDDEQKILKIYNAYLFFMSAWPKLEAKIKSLESEISVKNKQIDSLEKDLSMAKSDRNKFSKKYERQVKKRLEAEAWTPFGDAAPWYVAAGVTLLSTGVVIGASMSD